MYASAAAVSTYKATGTHDPGWSMSRSSSHDDTNVSKTPGAYIRAVSAASICIGEQAYSTTAARAPSIGPLSLAGQPLREKTRPYTNPKRQF
jgi:hypothetical protein